MKYIVIELTTPEQYSIRSDLFPEVTHTRIASFINEVPRPNDGKQGYLDIWFEKGYMNGTVFQLAPGFPGENVKIEEPELFNVIFQPTTSGFVGLELMRVLHTYCVNNGLIDGIIKELGSD